MQQSQIIIEEEMVEAYRQSLKGHSAELDKGVDIILPVHEINIPVDAIAGVVGLAGGALTGGGIMVGTVAIAVWPLAALFAAAGVTGFVVGLLGRARANRELKQETLRLLGTYAQDVIKQLRGQGREAFMKYHAQVMDNIGDMIAAEEDKIKSIQKRLEEEDGELAKNKLRISALNQLMDRTDKIEEQFSQFFAALPEVSGQVPQ